MDPINNIRLAPVPAFQPRPSASSESAPVLPKPDTDASAQLQQAEAPQVDTVEQRRFEAVRRAAQDIANQFVLGDTRFTIFKDTSGQYITRYTNLRDGRVTYIPEPDIFALTQRAHREAQPALTLDV